mgnify:CR=1 FL=1
MDIVSKEKRSIMMSGIKGKDTHPEIAVRKFLHANGFRFRLHRKDLPGKPDIVLPKLNTIIFVNGCFWHRHNCKKGKHLPKSNVDFWKDKLEKNKIRDRKNATALRDSGWQVLTIWECQTGDDSIMERMVNNKLC